MTWALVTGAGSGIGKALTQALVRRGIRVLGVGRRTAPLQATRQLDPNHIRVVSADVANPEGRNCVFQALQNLEGLRYVVHNAAMLAPVVPLAQVGLDDWRAHMAVNVEAPLFLTQKLLPLLAKGSRILHISSGAAHSAYPGWGAYCTSKAALNMVYRCLNTELADREIYVGSARPGVVDTPMQDEVRSAPIEVFPNLPRFIQLKEESALLAPDVVGDYLARLLIDVETDRFTEKEWDIRDSPIDD